MNISNLKNKNIHFVECENWNDAYGYEKSQMKEDTINYIEQLQIENNQLRLINKEHQQINGELRQANKLLNEQYIRLYKEYEQVKEDIRNVISLLDKNCDDLEGTEDEFDSLDKYQNIGHQEYME
jgi:N-acetylmuramoyl-L-alanine amidase CwlA